MTTYAQLKTAAAELEKLATAIETSEQESAVKLAAAESEAKTAAASVKTASVKDQAKLGMLAKTAAAAVKSAGLVSNDQQADSLAAAILGDHAVALAKMAEVAKFVPAAKLGSVVEAHTPVVQSADSAWDTRAAGVMRRLNI